MLNLKIELENYNLLVSLPFLLFSWSWKRNRFQKYLRNYGSFSFIHYSWLQPSCQNWILKKHILSFSQSLVEIPRNGISCYHLNVTLPVIVNFAAVVALHEGKKCKHENCSIPSPQPCHLNYCGSWIIDIVECIACCPGLFSWRIWS